MKRTLLTQGIELSRFSSRYELDYQLVLYQSQLGNRSNDCNLRYSRSELASGWHQDLQSVCTLRISRLEKGGVAVDFESHCQQNATNSKYMQSHQFSNGEYPFARELWKLRSPCQVAYPARNSLRSIVQASALCSRASNCCILGQRSLKLGAVQVSSFAVPRLPSDFRFRYLHQPYEIRSTVTSTPLQNIRHITRRTQLPKFPCKGYARLLSSCKTM